MEKHCKECNCIIENLKLTFCSNLCVCIYNRKQQKRKSIYEYYASPKKCLQCKKTIQMSDNRPASTTRRKKFCSHNCSARYSNKRRFISEITKAKQRLARMNVICPAKDTKIEKAIQKELRKRKIKFRKHEPIIGQPDIFIEPNICIFADGGYVHGDKRRFKSNDLLMNRKPAKYMWKYDKSITRKLRYRGYKVMRFWEIEINKDIKKVVDKIEKAME